MYGIINAAMANLDDSIPVFIGSPPETPAAAKAANATGGVMSAIIPK